MKPDSILLVGTGGKKYGMGHVVRMASLYGVLSAHYDTALLVNRDRLNSRLLKNSRTRFFEYASYPGIIDFVKRSAPYRLIVVDSVSLPDGILRKLRAHCSFLAVFDDLRRKGLERSGADLVIRPQEPFRRRIRRRKGIMTVEGADYFPLRKEYASYRRRGGFNKKVKNVLMSLGGAPSVKDTAPILALLDRTLAKDIKINVMPGYSGIRPKGRYSGRVVFRKRSEDMARLIAGADLGIISGGFVKFEMMCMGTPFCLVSINPHQEFLAKEFSSRGYGLYLGGARALRLNGDDTARRILAFADSGPSRKGMSVRSRKLVDGRGVSRITGLFKKLIQKEPL